MKMNRQIGTTVILSSIVATLIVAVVIADAPIVGQNNRVTVTYTNSTTTFTSILGLSLTLLPNTVYQFTVSIIYKGGVAQFAVAPLPAGTTFTVCGEEYNYAYAPNGGCTSMTGTSISRYQNTVGMDAMAFYTGSISTGPTGGTFQMQGGNAASGNTITVEVNSWIQAQVSSA